MVSQSDHNFAHAMTALLSWHVQNYDLIGSSKLKSEHKEILQDLNDELINDFWNGILDCIA